MMHRRETGSMLLEVIIAMSVLVVGLLGFFSAFMANARASGDVAEQDEVRVVMENLVETLHGEDFETLYGSYNGTWLEIPSLNWGDGYPGLAYVDFYVDESYIPSVFGPISDVDGSPGSVSTDCSASYKILPARVLLYYQNSASDYRVKQLFLTLGKY